MNDKKFKHKLMKRPIILGTPATLKLALERGFIEATKEKTRHKGMIWYRLTEAGFGEVIRRRLTGESKVSSS